MTDIIERRWGGQFEDVGGTGWYNGRHPNAGLLIDGSNDRDAWAALDADKAYQFPAGTSLVNTDVTVTVLALAPAPGFLLKPAAGVTVTIHGEIHAGRWQWIDLSAGGTVLLPDLTEVFPEWAGAVGDNTTASADAVEWAFSTGHMVRGGPDALYRLERGIVAPVGPVRIRSLRLRPDDTIAEDIAFQNTVAIKKATTLTSTPSVRLGTRTIDVADATGIEAGDILILKSDKLWPYSNQGTITKGEATVVRSVSGSQLELSIPLNCTYVDADENVTVTAYEPYDLDIDGLDIEYPIVASKHGCGLYNFKDATLRGLRFRNCGKAGGSIGESVNLTIEAPLLIENFLPSLGYGIQLVGCTGTKVVGGSGFMNRHCVDVSGQYPSHGCKAIGMNIIARDDEGSCLGGHGSSNGTEYSHNTCMGGYGITAGGPNAKLHGNTFIGCLYPMILGAPGFDVTEFTVVNEANPEGINPSILNTAIVTIQPGDGTVAEADFWLAANPNVIRGGRGRALETFIDIHASFTQIKNLHVAENDIILQSNGADVSFMRGLNASPVVADASVRIEESNVVKVLSGSYQRLRNITWPNPGLGTRTGRADGTAVVGHIGVPEFTSLTNGQVFTFTMLPAAGCSFIISDGSSGKGGEFFADYASATIVEKADPSGYFQLSSTPSAGSVGVYKSANSDVISIKNAVGSTRSLGICVLGAAVGVVTAPA